MTVLQKLLQNEYWYLTSPYGVFGVFFTLFILFSNSIIFIYRKKEPLRTRGAWLTIMSSSASMVLVIMLCIREQMSSAFPCFIYLIVLDLYVSFHLVPYIYKGEKFNALWRFNKSILMMVRGSLVNNSDNLERFERYAKAKNNKHDFVLDDPYHTKLKITDIAFTFSRTRCLAFLRTFLFTVATLVLVVNTFSFAVAYREHGARYFTEGCILEEERIVFGSVCLIYAFSLFVVILKQSFVKNIHWIPNELKWVSVSWLCFGSLHLASILISELDDEKKGTENGFIRAAPPTFWLFCGVSSAAMISNFVPIMMCLFSRKHMSVREKYCADLSRSIRRRERLLDGPNENDRSSTDPKVDGKPTPRSRMMFWRKKPVDLAGVEDFYKIEVKGKGKENTKEKRKDKFEKLDEGEEAEANESDIDDTKSKEVCLICQKPSKIPCCENCSHKSQPETLGNFVYMQPAYSVATTSSSRSPTTTESSVDSEESEAQRKRLYRVKSAFAGHSNEKKEGEEDEEDDFDKRGVGFENNLGYDYYYNSEDLTVEPVRKSNSRQSSAEGTGGASTTEPFTEIHIDDHQEELEKQIMTCEVSNEFIVFSNLISNDHYRTELENLCLEALDCYPYVLACTLEFYLKMGIYDMERRAPFVSELFFTKNCFLDVDILKLLPAARESIQGLRINYRNNEKLNVLQLQYLYLKCIRYLDLIYSRQLYINCQKKGHRL